MTKGGASASGWGGQGDDIADQDGHEEEWPRQTLSRTLRLVRFTFRKEGIGLIPDQRREGLGGEPGVHPMPDFQG